MKPEYEESVAFDSIQVVETFDPANIYTSRLGVFAKRINSIFIVD